MLKTRGNFELAIQAFDDALKLNPTDRILGKILIARGECKAKIGQYFMALFGVKKAQRNDALADDCLYNEARIMYELCEYEDAMTKFYQGCLAYPSDKRFKAGVLQCRQTIQECIGDQAGPVLVDMLRWIRIVEDQRQRIISGDSYGSSPGQKGAKRPISRTIIAAFVASGDISPARVEREEGVVLEDNSGGSGTVLLDQEQMKVIRKSIHNRMTRHYLGRFTEDYKFLEKLVSATSRVDDTAPEQDYGFWCAQDPAAALLSPANRKGSFSMLSRVRDMLALIKGVRESLRCREPYLNSMGRAKSYAERDKRREMQRWQKMGELKVDRKQLNQIPWEKLEQARQKAWHYLEEMRMALMNEDVAKCLACGERARDLVETLPPQAFALGRKDNMRSGKGGYVRAIAREIVPDVSHHKSLQSMPILLPQRQGFTAMKHCAPMAPLDESASNPCDIYEHSGPQVLFQSPSCGGELENAWLFYEMGRCRLETGHIELARRWSRRAVAAARRALAQDSAAIEDEEDEWGGSRKGNQEGASVWLVNAFLLTARVEAMAGSLENAESAMVNASDELTRKLPHEKNAQEWIRYPARYLNQAH
ncbi:outer dynein arm-docking complex subunit 4-like [Hetaerina americana]|uniref:outer dynein arm-docking complex subunit 4-like n=1 Tax=Hetaerina americana TaxID=62018 RepID=UPI003A7F51C5